MPIKKTAKKALRSSKRKRKHNLTLLKNLKTATKKANAKSLPKVYSLIDKVAKNHIIHKNKAARLKSKFAKKFATPATEEKKPVAKKVAKTRKKTQK